MDAQSNDIDSTTEHFNNSIHEELIPVHHNIDDTPAINSTNPDFIPPVITPSHHTDITNPVIDTLNRGKAELQKGQQQTEDIITKTKKIVKQHWDQTRHSLIQIQKKVSEMAPTQGSDLIYWRKPIQSGIAFGVSLSVIITFMFLSSLAAISFWSLAFLVVIGLYKMYNYVMATFVGRIQDDKFEAIFPSDMSISERHAQAMAHSIRINGTHALQHARDLFLWKNLTNSILFGLILFVFFYIGLSMNALTFILIGLIFLFTVPKIYQAYQVPIDRTAKNVLDQINQLLAKVTSKLPNKAKKA
ncbi:hypothetical protein I4U23_027961 [Adineta vaga]|nr:hypothetical protein I4U23_027961 [Adineta vaga]